MDVKQIAIVFLIDLTLAACTNSAEVTKVDNKEVTIMTKGSADTFATASEYCAKYNRKAEAKWTRVISGMPPFWGEREYIFACKS